MRFQSRKNFGYGRSLHFAAKLALREMYGGGHYASVAAHSARFSKFITFARRVGITDARTIDHETLGSFLGLIPAQVELGMLAKTYAVNIISSVNVALLALRGNKKLWLQPSVVGTISSARKQVPGYVKESNTKSIVKSLEDAGYFREAAMLLLGKDCGLRLKEASLLNSKSSLMSARRAGVIIVEKGTKGGQRRTVPIKTNDQFVTLTKAQRNQIGTNFVPARESYAVFRRRLYRVFRKFGICGDFSFRELRAAFACHEYRRITGHLAPVMGGAAPPYLDRAARLQIAEQLGHHRISITASYFGKLK